jgi:hypothetical protein
MQLNYHSYGSACCVAAPCCCRAGVALPLEPAEILPSGEAWHRIRRILLCTGAGQLIIHMYSL